MSLPIPDGVPGYRQYASLVRPSDGPYVNVGGLDACRFVAWDQLTDEQRRRAAELLKSPLEAPKRPNSQNATL